MNDIMKSLLVMAVNLGVDPSVLYDRLGVDGLSSAQLKDVVWLYWHGHNVSRTVHIATMDNVNFPRGVLFL